MPHLPTLTRRTMLTGLSANLGALAVLPGAAQAFESCTEFYEEEIWPGLGAAFSVPYGPQDRDGQIYAMVAPWCPYCRQMKAHVDAGQVPARVSFIPVEPRDVIDRRRIAYLLASGDPDAVEVFFDRRSRPPANRLSDQEETALLNVQQNTMHSLRFVLEAMGKQPGFPAWAAWARAGKYMPRDGLYIGSGWVTDPKKISRNLQFQASAPTSNLRSWQALGHSMNVRPFDQSAFAVADRTVARVLPLDQAMPSYCYDKGFGHQYTGIVQSDGKDWYVLTSQDGFSSYVEAASMKVG